jgi:predicted MPP superfamily phosphohydrolase
MVAFGKTYYNNASPQLFEVLYPLVRVGLHGGYFYRKFVSLNIQSLEQGYNIKRWECILNLESEHMANQQIKIHKTFKRRKFLKASALTVAGMGTVGVGTYYYSKTVEPAWFDTTYLTLRLPHLTPAFQGYRLVQISDIHTDSTFMTANRLAELVRQVNALQADLLVITGDFVTHYMPADKVVLAELRHLRAKDGIFGVMGNHDHASDVGWVRFCLQGTNVQELSNATHTVRRGEEMLHIVGMDDLWPMNRGVPQSVWTHLPLLQHMTASLPEQGVAVLLVHEPDFADVAAHVGRYDLELSGHSHGGQVRLPLAGALALPPLAHNYPCGLYQVKNMIHYTNRGLGMVPPKVRLNCRPEITVFELLAT